jgi:DNA modification methylase
MKLIAGDCLTVMRALGQFDCIFADPPDNIGLGYETCNDNLPDEEYLESLRAWFLECTLHSSKVWFSFNAKWTAQFGEIVAQFLRDSPGWTYHACTQVFTFGQHNDRWLGNNHRPLWCIYHRDAEFFADDIRIESWRQRNGDKRANPRGRVPGDVLDMQYPFDVEQWLTPYAHEISSDGWEAIVAQLTAIHPGDVFDFPRVTGNSKQRQDWHPTQLHEELVERVVKFSCGKTGQVLDPFAGTGTTLRVCDRIGRDGTSIEMDRSYCEKIAEQLGLKPSGKSCWLRKSTG